MKTHVVSSEMITLTDMTFTIMGNRLMVYSGSC